MLVLSRKAGESIHIGNGITVEVAHISAKQVKLLIDAPREVSVDRSEIRLRKLAEDKAKLAVTGVTLLSGVLADLRSVPR